MSEAATVEVNEIDYCASCAHLWDEHYKFTNPSGVAGRYRCSRCECVIKWGYDPDHEGVR